MKQKLSDRIAKKIEEEKIKPIPRINFVLKSWFIWTLVLANQIVGSIGFGITFYLVNNGVDLDIISDSTLLQKIIFTIPIFWIILTGISLFVAYINFKNTEEGYKFKPAIILGLGFLISLFFGYLIYKIELAEELNTVFSDTIPYYNQIADMRYAVWQNPEEGKLAGEITEVDSDLMILTIEDLDGQLWAIDYSDATVKNSVTLSPKTVIKIIGKVTDNFQENSNFKASEIRPWDGKNSGSGQPRED